MKVVGDNLTSAPPGSVANLTQWVSQRLVPEHAATGERATGRQAMGPQESASEVDDIRLIAGGCEPTQVLPGQAEWRTNDQHGHRR